MTTRFQDAEELFLRAEPVTVSPAELEQIASDGVPPEAVRTMLYMHDVEFHTACYVRDVLVTRAHSDPVTSAFIMRWGYEETHHGCVVAAILSQIGVRSGSARVAATRHDARLTSRLRPIGYFFLDYLIPFSAIHMVEGAVNEWTAQAAYRLLAKKVGSPTLTSVFNRIIRQEGDHAAFYSHHAKLQLADSRAARAFCRYRFKSNWQPVGDNLVGSSEVDFVGRYLFNDDAGRDEVARIDRKLQQLPGMEDMRPMQWASDRYLGSI